jgi:hypothetical protein
LLRNLWAILMAGEPMLVMMTVFSTAYVFFMAVAFVLAFILTN